VNARASALGERIHEPAAQLAALEDVRFEVDAALRRGNGGELRFIELLAIGKQFDAAVAVDFGFGDCADQPAKFIGIEPVWRPFSDPVAQCGLKESQEQGEALKRHRNEGKDKEPR
jgi:hypothetical protein